MNIKNLLVGLMIFLCVLFSALRIRKFYRMNFPVANPGQCVALNIEEVGIADAKIINNYKEKTTSLLIIYSVNNQPIFFPVFLSYQTQRNYGAEKVRCP